MPDSPTRPADLRKNYDAGVLLESEAATDPFDQFGKWFADAQAASVIEPNAMTLATADATGRPSARIVLLKGFDANGFVFYTNYTSRKASDLAANGRASLVFWWAPLERQVRVDGAVSRVSADETEAYFHSRPRGSQIGAWASHQSQAVDSREVIERRQADLERQFADQPVPVPDFWGGYRVAPSQIEFWQGRPSRLHDRLQYTRVDGVWSRRRLEP